MPDEIKSTTRIDELLKKGITEGLSNQEKDELLTLLKERGVVVRPIECFVDGGKNVH